MTMITLKEIYQDPAHQGSLGGETRFYNAAKKLLPKLTRAQVHKFLQTQYAYTRLKPRRQKYQRRKIVAVDMNDLYQGDLADMQKFAKFNDNYRFLFFCIDMFTKMLFVIPVFSKKPVEMIRAVTIIFKKYGIPLKFNFDNGTEMKNTLVKTFMKELGIVLYFTRNDDIKCAGAERAIRTIKERLWVYMTENNGYRYIDVLQSVVDGYNNDVHSSTGFAPSLVGEKECKEIRGKMLLTSDDSNPQKYYNGDYVRISMRKGVFEHGYEHKFSDEIFIIYDTVKSASLNLYRIKDRSDEKVTGLFYEQELSKVEIESTEGYRIDKILRTRKRNGKEEYLVHWSGYSSAHDTWEPKENLK